MFFHASCDAVKKILRFLHRALECSAAAFQRLVDEGQRQQRVAVGVVAVQQTGQRQHGLLTVVLLLLLSAVALDPCAPA